MEISGSVFQTIKRFPQVRCVLSSFALDAVGHAIKHLCGLPIERPLFHAHGFRQLKARELGAILPQRNSRQEKDTQLSLTLNDSIAPCQPLLSGRAELQYNTVSRSPHRVEVIVDPFSKSIAALGIKFQVSR